MNAMQRIAVLNSLSRGTPLAAARKSLDHERLAWIGVYPLDLSSHLTQEFLRNNGIEIFPLSGRAYRIRTFEVQRQLIEADVSIGESQLENTTSQIVFNEDNLLRALEAIGVAIESLELPSKIDYPI